MDIHGDGGAASALELLVDLGDHHAEEALVLAVRVYCRADVAYVLVELRVLPDFHFLGLLDEDARVERRVTGLL
jgi:hypothetical protein